LQVNQYAIKPVMTIKPLRAKRILPAVGLAFIWNSSHLQDIVTIDTAIPDEAREVMALSLDMLNRRCRKIRSKRHAAKNRCDSQWEIQNSSLMSCQ